jgi:hypothetical protein
MNNFAEKIIFRFTNKLNIHYLPGLRWRLSLNRWQSSIRLLLLKNKHLGQRCFIIGNGPSLNKMDLSCLKHEFTFGLNRIYLLFPRLGFNTSYYVAVNRFVIDQFADDINRIAVPKFISWYSRNSITFDKHTMFIRDAYKGNHGFSRWPISQIWEGSTVTYVALQLAYFMGFQQVLLVGVDHSFNVSGEPHKLVKSTGPDSSHFDPNYFGPGYSWQLPDLEASEKSYKLAKKYFELDGREILDATVGGKLNVYRKILYEDLFN